MQVNESPARLSCISNSFRLLENGQLDPEAAPLPFFGLNANAPSKAFDPLFDNGQTDPSAWICLHIMQPFEDPENSLLMFRGNPDAVVLDPRSNLTLPRL